MILFLHASPNDEFAHKILWDSGLTIEECRDIDTLIVGIPADGPVCVVGQVVVASTAVMDRIRALAPHCNVVVLLDAGDAAGVVRSLRNGAFDCVVAPLVGDELITAVQTALADSAKQLQIARATWALRQTMDALTERELEVVPLICEGLSNKQVAAKLDISIKTVANHRSQILKKTAARNTAHMVQLVTRAASVLPWLLADVGKQTFV